jgi:hypothetical protein
VHKWSMATYERCGALQKELEGFGLRLNKKPPNISFQKKDKGGINFTSIVTAPRPPTPDTRVRSRTRCRRALLRRVRYHRVRCDASEPTGPGVG